MYSFIIDYTLTEAEDIVEPVTVEEAKQYCRVTNDVEEWLFVQLITQSRQAIEKATGLSLVPKDCVLWFTNYNGDTQLPYGPVQEFKKLYNEKNEEITPPFYTLIGAQYPTLLNPRWANLKATYSCGFENDKCPSELKIAMLDQINYGYENRGMDVNDMGICEKTWRVCQRWTKTSPIL